MPSTGASIDDTLSKLRTKEQGRVQRAGLQGAAAAAGAPSHETLKSLSADSNPNALKDTYEHS